MTGGEDIFTRLRCEASPLGRREAGAGGKTLMAGFSSKGENLNNGVIIVFYYFYRYINENMIIY